jgi:hypothetical protein
VIFGVLCRSPFPAQLAARDFLLHAKRDQIQSSLFSCLAKCCQALIVYFNWLQFLDFFCEWIVAGGSRSVLESPDQKTQGCIVEIALKRQSLEHVHMVFGEMPVRT